MSKTKAYIEDRIAKLAEETCYDFDFLMDIWNDECEYGDGDFRYFCEVTKEQDW